jgi:hypothetical protein
MKRGSVAVAFEVAPVFVVVAAGSGSSNRAAVDFGLPLTRAQ